MLEQELKMIASEFQATVIRIYGEPCLPRKKSLFRAICEKKKKTSPRKIMVSNLANPNKELDWHTQKED